MSSLKISEKILNVANWLESCDNQILVDAEGNDESFEKIASSFVIAAEILRDVAEQVKEPEAVEPVSGLSMETIEDMAVIASLYAESDDEALRKQADVLDEVLFALADSKSIMDALKASEDFKIEELKKKYKGVKEQLDADIGAKKAIEAIEKSPMYKERRPLEAPLSTRTCPDHPGAQFARVGTDKYQCSLDHKIYDYEEGFTTLKGEKVPGGSVTEQNPKFNDGSHQMFDTREQRIGNQG